MSDYRKTIVAALTTVLMALQAGLADGSIFLPKPWDMVALGVIGTVLVFFVPNGDKDKTTKN